jgi:hypothetical protein
MLQVALDDPGTTAETWRDVAAEVLASKGRIPSAARSPHRPRHPATHAQDPYGTSVAHIAVTAMVVLRRNA